MGACDELITDYSSCFIDFALLERPIVFYTPDEKRFLTESEDMDSSFFKLCELNKATTPKELASLISKPDNKVAEETNKIFQDRKIKGTCYSENVYMELAKVLHLN
jgi:CDP-glycerol glycerophosphotransferase (TagB/SpsB family)